ncbi:hypothetical protein HY639_03880 [Candidatus Woesearchaeota archaeon]|nr:hypothetical protein [Candidatus Woesearchaeota archaeon]
MVVERLFKEQMLKKQPAFALGAGVFFTVVGFITSYLLFKPFVGLATILFTVILALPSLMRLFELEEEEQKEGVSFLTKNETLIDFYLYFFIGSFMVFFLIAIYNTSLVFSLDDLSRMDVPRGYATEGFELPPPPSYRPTGEITKIFMNNFYVMLISFVLSLFYGAGSLFLITFNGSIFASTLAKVIKLKIPKDPSWYTYTFSLFGNVLHFSPEGFWFTYTFMACNVGIMFFHGIPEVLAYFFAAIAGGVLSEGFVREKFLSKGFFKIIKNAVWLLILAIVVLYVAAIIEIDVSKMLFTKDVCVKNRWFVNSILLTLIGGIIAFETARKYLWKKPAVAAPVKTIVTESKQLTEYIAKNLAKGFNESAIRKRMKELGYSDEIVNFHFERAKWMK